MLYDVDGVLRSASLRLLLRRVRRRLTPAAWDRRSALGMSGLLRQLVTQLDGPEVVYVTAAPPRAVRLVRKRLAQDRYPEGTLVCTAGTWLGWLLGRDRQVQRQSLQRVVTGPQALRWVLIGDDGRQDPELFGELMAAAPERVARSRCARW